MNANPTTYSWIGEVTTSEAGDIPTLAAVAAGGTVVVTRDGQDRWELAFDPGADVDAVTWAWVPGTVPAAELRDYLVTVAHVPVESIVGLDAPMYCDECGELMIVDGVGVTYHDPSLPDSYDLDAEHVALNRDLLA